MRKLFPPIWLLVAVLVTGVFAFPGNGSCDLYMEFLLDRSGSMWAPVRGRAKILTVTDTINKVIEELPPDVAMGLRVYPAPKKDVGRSDPGLRILMEKGNRDLFPGELARLLPQGKAFLPEHLTKAFKDFPHGEDSKVLILLCDAADFVPGSSFCDTEQITGAPEGLRFHIFSLNLKDENEKEELNCLTKQIAGRVTHLSRNDSLLSSVLSICRDAYKSETQRQTRALEEEKKRKLLAEKTRLTVTFNNNLDPFFADTIQVVQFHLDGKKVPLSEAVNLRRGETMQLLDSPIPKGTHRLAVKYKMLRGEEVISSKESTQEVDVEKGKTSSVLCCPRGGFFHWDCSFKTETP